MKTLEDLKRELLVDPVARSAYEAMAAEFDMARDLISARSGRALILPTPAEDIVITAAALADPDAVPLSAQAKPLVRRGAALERDA